jgi:hypothetical protein
MRKVLSVVGVLLVACLTWAVVSAGGPASAASAIMNVFVTNDTSHPVPTRPIGNTVVSGSVSVDNFPSATPPALWQGTPFVDSHIDINVGIENCLDFTIPAGNVLYLVRAVADYNVAPGGTGGAKVGVTPLGGSAERIAIPTAVDAPAAQFDGNHPRYTGAVDIGLPVTAVSSCTRGSGLNGTVTIMGYLVPAS